MRLFVLLTSWVKFGSTQVDDCALPACSTVNCDSTEQVECNRICLTGDFGGTNEDDCPEADKVNKGNCDATTCGSVNDCVLDACPDDTCGGKEITCTRTCNGANFGEPGCPSDQENRKETCAVKTCADCFQACSTTDCTPKEFKCNDANDNEITKSCGFAECDSATSFVADPGPDTYLVQCAPTGMTVIILDSYFATIGIAPDSTHLRNPSAFAEPCTIKAYPDLGYMSYYVPLFPDICGTEAESNNDEITFSNQVLGAPPAGGVINRGSYFKLDFQCDFKSHEIVSIGAINPKKDTITEEEAISATFPAEMHLYTTDLFEVIKITPFNIDVPAKLYGEVNFKLGTPAEVTAQLQKCWATPTKDGNHATQDVFIDEFKAVAATTTIFGDGNPSSVAQFSMESFNWNDSEFTQIFLNCNVFICDTEVGTTGNCKRPIIPDGGRRRRAIDAADENLSRIQIGPIDIQ